MPTDIISEGLARFGTLGVEAMEVWLSGGWAMIAIAVISIAMFALGTHIYLMLAVRTMFKVRESVWKRWLEHPEEGKGDIGELLREAARGETVRDTVRIFEELKAAEIAPFVRDLRVMKICVGAAPLLGLLGTVTGMLFTFGALASGSGGEKTMGQIAEGISEALITTETGLVISLPGLFFQYQLSRKLQRYRSYLARLETFCIQSRFGGSTGTTA